VLEGIVYAAARRGENQKGRIAAEDIEEAEWREVGLACCIHGGGKGDGAGTYAAQQQAMAALEREIVWIVRAHESISSLSD
jgi:hypothetical protein